MSAKSAEKLSESDICYDCAVFQNIGGELVRGGKYIAVTKSPIGGIDWELPSMTQKKVWLNFTDKTDPSDILRFHTINNDSLKPYDELFAGDLSVGTYCYDSDLGALTDSAREADGDESSAVAVCRADARQSRSCFHIRLCR